MFGFWCVVFGVCGLRFKVWGLGFGGSGFGGLGLDFGVGGFRGV